MASACIWPGQPVPMIPRLSFFIWQGGSSSLYCQSGSDLDVKIVRLRRHTLASPAPPSPRLRRAEGAADPSASNVDFGPLFLQLTPLSLRFQNLSLQPGRAWRSAPPRFFAKRNFRHTLSFLRLLNCVS